MDQIVTDLPAVETAEEGRVILRRVKIAIANAVHVAVEASRIRRMPDQPRKYFNQAKLDRLTDSIKDCGQLFPGYVRKVELDEEGHDHELLDGERRLRAIHAAEVQYFKAMLVDIDDEAARYLISIIANFNREGHTLLEQVDAIVVMREKLKLSIKEIADATGDHPAYVTNLYGIRRLVPEVRAMLEEGLPRKKRLPSRAAIAISCLPDERRKEQISWAKKVLKKKVSISNLVKVMARAAGDDGRESRSMQPHTIRKDINRRTDLLNRKAVELRERIEDIKMPTLKAWGRGQVKDCHAKLLAARDQINDALRALEIAADLKAKRAA
jgi:ParB/RepB/Spo0J family partition protein